MCGIFLMYWGVDAVGGVQGLGEGTYSIVGGVDEIDKSLSRGWVGTLL